MGLLKVGVSALVGVLEDQWREYFYCESLPSDVLVKKGLKRTSKRGLNKGNNNIISNGSIIAVNEGQAMVIVEQGKVVEFSAEPGEFVYDTSTEPSVFTSPDLANNIKATFMQIGKRFTFGGEPPKNQRVYYINKKEVIGNKYGTPAPVPFRVIDRNIGLDIDISIRCHGEYSYQIVDPILFYTNVTGNVENDYTRDRIDSQLKTEVMTALQPAFAEISKMGVRYSEIPAHTTQLSDALNKVLSEKWQGIRGIRVISFGVSTLKASEEDESMLKQLQRNATLRNPSMAAAHLTGAQAEAMQHAAKNEGAVTGFMGMNMAQQVGGVNAAQLFQMNEQNHLNKANEQKVPQSSAESSNVPKWMCSCGEQNSSKFCSNCGKSKPSNEGWQCECGTINKGKFCVECGKHKPVGARQYVCDKCGWEPADSTNPPNFCVECGDPINSDDVK